MTSSSSFEYMKENTSKNSTEISHIAREVILKDEIKTLARRSGQKTKKERRISIFARTLKYEIKY